MVTDKQKLYLIIVVIALFVFSAIYFNEKDKKDNEIKKAPLLELSTYSFTYYLSNENQPFSDFEKQKIADAFKIISNNTNNHFVFSEINNPGKADFIFYFTNITSEEVGNSYVLGKEYYPFYKNQPDMINIGNSYISDPYPRIEIHEILHGLGLEHSEKTTDNIMYEYLTYARLENDRDTIQKLYDEWGIWD